MFTPLARWLRRRRRGYRIVDTGDPDYVEVEVTVSSRNAKQVRYRVPRRPLDLPRQ